MCSLPLDLFRGWRAALLLAAATCCTPATAAAGCGDYVTIRPGDGEPASHPATDPSRDGPLTPVPCHGPTCSGSPARDPLAPTAPPVTHAASKDGVRLGGSESDPVSSRPRFPIPTSDACPPGTVPSIFHPPRAG